MATIPLDSAEPQAARPSLSQHPAFPLVVALWFATLLGLGSFVLPAILLERAAEASGLTAILPAAEPPLGATARLLFAVAGAVAGALFGWVMGRFVANANGPAPAPVAAAARRPIRARDELGEDGLDGAPPLRRRQVTAAQDKQEDDLSWLALPEEITTPEREGHDEGVKPEVSSPDALELTEIAPAPVEEAVETAIAEDIAMDDAPPTPYPSLAEMDRRRGVRRSRSGKAPGGLERRLFLRRADDEALPFVAPSTARGTPVNENTIAEGGVGEGSSRDQAAQVLPVKAQAPEPAAGAWQDVPLEALGLVQLVERLGASIASRGARPCPPAPQPSATFAGEFDAAAPDEAAAAMAQYFGSAAKKVETSEADARAEEQGDEALRRALAALQRMSSGA